METQVWTDLILKSKVCTYKVLTCFMPEEGAGVSVQVDGYNVAQPSDRLSHRGIQCYNNPWRTREDEYDSLKPPFGSGSVCID